VLSSFVAWSDVIVQAKLFYFTDQPQNPWQMLAKPSLGSTENRLKITAVGLCTSSSCIDAHSCMLSCVFVIIRRRQRAMSSYIVFACRHALCRRL